ncbi:MAG: S-methyl-5-thioribose-1-phosphate isomerase [Candidatus Omnitrophica bacterium]|nr:S-methyl-5-thioribose-1-phosphate isomerase [Candidatus Omnitrophota bacterium]MDD5042498.1 S-methyl-5-thioribose-1-phosphate isomerase [Candidatus Omnitrophota bacterium]MDD5501007.1 S-methyl-5-thioribose-1-phosphate isomerase [Candidatus Omnitrophota bacterium]
MRTIEWKANKIRIIDQTKLPGALVFRDIGDLKTLWESVKMMWVRGAPALGIAAALGMYLGIRDCPEGDWKNFLRVLDKTAGYIKSSRPTARDLFYGIERILNSVGRGKRRQVDAARKAVLEEAKKMILEDTRSCRRIGRYGKGLLKPGASVLTICNAGSLATVDYGTALGVVYAACSAGKKIKVFACETRPLLQGSRLTCWELLRAGVDVTLIADNTAAALMSTGKVDCVITGADRIALNGDTANKIGTLNLALLCRHHRIPFYVAAPKKTFDFKIRDGRGINIEMRGSEEVSKILFKRETSPRSCKVLNPAFDVTDCGLISAIVTDYGVIRPPYSRNIRRILGRTDES